MPSPNLEKIYIADSYYHVYNRGVNKRKIFLDDSDYSVFLNLLKRYLGAEPAKDNNGREYVWLHNELELLAFCLMPNHFHLFIYQKKPEAMTRLLRGVGTSFAGYFNKKYHRSGPLFQDRFKASMITSDTYLTHASRYIHLNPGKGYKTYEWSSLPYYLTNKYAAWVQPLRIMGLFEPGEYAKFVADYKDQKEILSELKTELAD